MRLSSCVFALTLVICACAPRVGDDGDDVDMGSCEQYVDCVASVDPPSLGEVLEAYGDEGSCWDGDDDLAELCFNACDAGLVDLLAVDPTATECVGDDVPALFEGQWDIDLRGKTGGMVHMYDTIAPSTVSVLSGLSDDSFEWFQTFGQWDDRILECDLDGASFDCEDDYGSGWDDYAIEIAGEFVSHIEAQGEGWYDEDVDGYENWVSFEFMATWVSH